MNDITIKAEVRKCRECGMRTIGSIGPTGNYWSMVCQSCKDFADGLALHQARLVAAIAPPASRPPQPARWVRIPPLNEHNDAMYRSPTGTLHREAQAGWCFDCDRMGCECDTQPRRTADATARALAANPHAGIVVESEKP